MKIYWDLFVAFFKTGLFTFGGGYAMLPLLKAEVVSRRGWITEDELLDFFAIGQCTPGIIAVNVSTFCGYKLRGIPGGVVSTLAMILPSVIIITLIAAILNGFVEQPLVVHAFAGIRLGVTALLINLIIDMAVRFYKQSSCRRLHIGIFALAAALLLTGKVTAVIVVIIAALTGFIPYYKGRRS